MRVESWVGMTAVLMMIVFVGAIAAEQQCRRRSPLPANVFLLHDIAEPLARIYEQAPSFRAQCERIAAAKWLRVTVRVDPHMPSRCRAFTILRRSGRQMFADVHLPVSSDHSEMLAHEFEHILEQIEGLDLRTLSRVKGSGVREVEYAVFETARAQAAGEAVAAEAGRSARSPAAD
jgi:hypothetical protein